MASSLEQIQSLHKIDDRSKDCLFVFIYNSVMSPTKIVNLFRCRGRGFPEFKANNVKIKDKYREQVWIKTCMEESMLAAYLLYKMICGVQMSPASRFTCLIFPYSDVFHNRLTSRHC